MMLITSKEAALLPLIILGFWNLKAVSCEEPDASVRNQKHFSLFSVVTFKNEECASESDYNGGAVTGTCYSSTECTDKSGTKSGNCAAGFGVCCIFMYSLLTSTTISENRTYIQNPLYPAVETTGAGTTTTYTINKMSSDICQVRLDFDYFRIAGPANTGEQGVALANGNCLDSLIPTLSGGAVVPSLCGILTGMHLYMDLGMDSTDTAALALTLASTTITASVSGITVANAYRSFRFKTSQIPCWATYRAPEGCNQYHMTLTGQIHSPNFSKDTDTTRRGANLSNTGVDLMNLDLKYCLRRERNTCCILYQVCTQFEGADLTSSVPAPVGTVLNGDLGEVTEGWSFDTWLLGGGTATALTIAMQDVGLVDGACTGDYIEIPDSSTGLKSFGAAVGNTNTRYCGTRLGFIPVISLATAMSHAPLWDCTEPFEVRFRTDQMNDNGVQGTTVATDDKMRGLCLDYRQEQC